MSTQRFVSLGIILGLLLPSCAAYERAAAKQRGGEVRQAKQRRGDATAAKRQIPLETKKPEGQDLATVSTPARLASNEVVAEGLASLKAGQFERALQSFQEATTLDGSNGVAYYYLARTHFTMGHVEQAAGILDRAEALLAQSEEWSLRIAAFREELALAART